MENLTLVIPAKNEKESLPVVLKELNKFKLKIIVVLEKTDTDTINAIKSFNCKILYQNNKGYGDALIQGINSVRTKYFSIFNADGSFNPLELRNMYKTIQKDKIKFVFASRYEADCSSDDDTFVTYFGNFLFTKLGRIFFGLKITDILYTFVMGSTEVFKNLNIQNKDFTFCVELPIKANKQKILISTSKSNERIRIGGKKKVNALKDGFLILISMLKLFFSK
jgi:glycosyltransferase involved in cell wall biosynthesis